MVWRDVGEVLGLGLVGRLEAFETVPLRLSFRTIMVEWTWQCAHGSGPMDLYITVSISFEAEGDALGLGTELHVLEEDQSVE